MKTVAIYFDFRTYVYKAHVQVHSDFYTVFISDKGLINDFGSTVIFNQHKVAIAYLASDAPDVQDFHKSIARQLR